MYRFDQSFSAENFRTVFDYENRKGINLEKRFFPHIVSTTNKIKLLTKAINKLKQARSTKLANQKKLIKLEESKLALKEMKSERLMYEFENISTDIAKEAFRIQFTRNTIPSTKPIYATTRSDARSFFALKQLQINLKRLYKLTPGNRYDILCQLRSILADDFQKVVIRTDMKDFYESIDRRKLLSKLLADSLLTYSSKRFIKQIL